MTDPKLAAIVAEWCSLAQVYRADARQTGSELVFARASATASTLEMCANRIEQAAAVDVKVDGMYPREMCERMAAPSVAELTAELADARRVAGYLNHRVAWWKSQARKHKKAASLEAGGGWRDIASAPRDGTMIVLACASFASLARWDERFAWVHSDATGGGAFRPTHWQPLPAPPAPTKNTNQSGENHGS